MEKTTKTRKKKVKVHKPDLKTIYDVLSDVKFVEILTSNLSEVSDQYLTIKRSLNRNQSLKRDSFVRLKEMGLWDSESMVKEYVLILEKKSKLSSLLRTSITAEILYSAQKTLEYYGN